MDYIVTGSLWDSSQCLERLNNRDWIHIKSTTVRFLKNEAPSLQLWLMILRKDILLIPSTESSV